MECAKWGYKRQAVVCTQLQLPKCYCTIGETALVLVAMMTFRSDSDNGMDMSFANIIFWEYLVEKGVLQFNSF